MADTTGSIFNKAATERLRSPDDLDKYVRVTNPSVWAILGACFTLVLGLLAWGIFGTVSTSINTLGARVDDQVVCFLSAEDMTKLEVNDEVIVSGEHMKVSGRSKVPVSREEAGLLLQSDYLLSSLMKDDWAYVVYISGNATNLDSYVPLNVNITVERIAPISLILQGRS